MKQQVIKASSAESIVERVETALSFGWLVQNIVVNSETNWWIAIMYKDE